MRCISFQSEKFLILGVYFTRLEQSKARAKKKRYKNQVNMLPKLRLVDDFAGIGTNLVRIWCDCASF
jgi:hypothetical protein